MKQCKRSRAIGVFPTALSICWFCRAYSALGHLEGITGTQLHYVGGSLVLTSQIWISTCLTGQKVTHQVGQIHQESSTLIASTYKKTISSSPIWSGWSQCRLWNRTSCFVIASSDLQIVSERVETTNLIVNYVFPVLLDHCCPITWQPFVVSDLSLIHI